MTTARPAPQAVRAPRSSAVELLVVLVLVLAIVLAASMIGIWTRPLGFLASIWPANAIALGLFVRSPRLAGPTGWVAALAGMVAADLLTGSALDRAVVINLGNVLGVFAGWLVLRRLRPSERRLASTASALKIAGVCVVAALGGSLLSPYVGMRWFGMSGYESFELWFLGELANYLAILPLVLAVPRRADRRADAQRPQVLGSATLRLVVATVCLAAALAVGLSIDGPLVLVVGLPVLLASALQAGVFQTAVLVTLNLVTLMVAIGLGFIDVGLGFVQADGAMPASIRIGLSIISLGPLMVAASTSEKLRALEILQGRVDRDALTGALTRGALLEQAHHVRRSARATGAQLAVMMVDLDRFKSINDTYGHAFGDRVLVAVVDEMRACLRDSDLVGRLGGEEFAVVAVGVNESSAVELAERLREHVAAITLRSGSVEVATTASIGVTHAGAADRRDLDELLLAADEALYAAKRAGRDRVVLAPARSRAPRVDG